MQAFARALAQAAEGGSAPDRTAAAARFLADRLRAGPALSPAPVAGGGALVAGLAVLGGTGVLLARRRGGPEGMLLSAYQGQQAAPDANVEDTSLALLWSADSRRILSVGGKDGVFHCWDALTGARVSTDRPLLMKTSDDIVRTVQWRQQDPLRLWLDGTVVRLTDVVTGQNLSTLDETGSSPDGIEALAWSPDGSLIHVHRGADGGSVSSFHPPYPQGADTDAWIQQRPFFLAWSPVSTRLLSWGEDGLLYIWRVSTGALLLVNKRYAHSSQAIDARMLAWSPARPGAGPLSRQAVARPGLVAR